MKRHNIEPAKLMPFFSFLAIFLVFFALSGGKNLALFNIQAILDQTIVVMIGGLGAIFVIAMGSVDLSIGITLALSGILSSIVAEYFESPILIIPAALLTGAIVGLVTGTIVSKFKVPSFMATLAILIGMRGVVNYIQTQTGLHYFPKSMKWLGGFDAKVAILVILIVVVLYLFEGTKLGKHCKAIGENETAAKFVGVPTDRIRITSYVISGVMASVASLITMASLGGTSTTMGVFFELQVMIAIFLGGVLVTGGSTTRVYKLIIGAFTITVIENGLILIGYSSSEVSEAVKGVLLMAILFFTIYFNDDSRKMIQIKTKKPKRHDSKRT